MIKKFFIFVNTFILLCFMCVTSFGNSIEDNKRHLIQIVNDDNESGEDWLIFRQNNKFGYMDKEGNIKINAQFDYAADFIEGRALVGNNIRNIYTLIGDVMDNTYWGFIDVKGVQVIPIKYDYAKGFNKGFAFVTKDGESYYIDKSGSKADLKVESMDFTNGFSPKLIEQGPNFPSPIASKEVWTYINTNGDLATDKEFEKAMEFNSGFAIVKNNGKYGLIDTNFDVIIDYKYDDMQRVDTYLFAAKIGDKYGLIDQNDNVIANFEYLYIGNFNNGLAVVRKLISGSGYSAKYIGAYMDSTGNLSLNSKFSVVGEFVDGYACVADKNTDKYGVIDCTGNYVIMPKFYSLIQSKCGLFEAKDKPGIDYYYINLKGNIIVPH